MGFDTANRVVYGDDAREVPSWARATLIAYLEAKLNDPDGPYYAKLELSPVRPVIVTDVADVAQALYGVPQPEEGEEMPDTCPIVFVMEGASSDERNGKRINGVTYRGRRHSLGFRLDSGVESTLVDDDDPAHSNPVDLAKADSALAHATSDVFTRGRADLAALGLFAFRVTNDDEAQRAGIGRNPRLLSCFALALDNYSP